jgi:hypothetical protein
MESRIKITVLAVALTLTTQIAAQQTNPPPTWHAGSAVFSTASEPAKALFPAGYTATSSTRAGEFEPMIAGKPLSSDAWQGSHVADQDTSRIADSFKTQSRTATLTKRLLYVTSPFWLSHSRPFPTNSNPQAQPDAPLINDSASLTWPAFKE